jgi:hypothetical protein
METEVLYHFHKSPPLVPIKWIQSKTPHPVTLQPNLISFPYFAVVLQIYPCFKNSL